MILLNNTRVSNEALRAVLSIAAKEAGSLTSGTVVQVNQGKTPGSSGMAWDCSWVNWKDGRKRRRIHCPGHAFRIVLPGVFSDDVAKKCDVPVTKYDALAGAVEFYGVATHEFAHIRDYRQGGRRKLEWSRSNAHGRRPAHDRRPEECRANHREAEARARAGRYSEEILALALEMDEKSKK